MTDPKLEEIVRKIDAQFGGRFLNHNLFCALREAKALGLEEAADNVGSDTRIPDDTVDFLRRLAEEVKRG